MVTGGSTMLARAGIDPLEAAFWPLTAIATGLVLGMLPALLDPHGPERATVATLERATKAFEEAKDDKLARHHQAQTALATAWEAIADAGIVRAGRVVIASQQELVDRTLKAQKAIVKRNQADSGAVSETLFESTNLIDPERTAMPHSRPTARYRIYRSLTADSHAMVTAKKVLVAGLATGVVGVALGLNRPDWGVISALLILQNGPEKIPGTIRGTHRVLGSILGLGLFSMFYLFGVDGWTMLAALAICQFFAEIMVVKNYALCVIFSTPLALLMGGIEEPLGDLVISRSSEIALSVLFAFIVLWFMSNSSKARKTSGCRCARTNPCPLSWAACSRELPMMHSCNVAICSMNCSPSAVQFKPWLWTIQNKPNSSGKNTVHFSTPAMKFWTIVHSALIP